MHTHGYKPNIVSYTALLNGMCWTWKSLRGKRDENMSEEQWWSANSIVDFVGKRTVWGLWCGKRNGVKGFFLNSVEINLNEWPKPTAEWAECIHE